MTRPLTARIAGLTFILYILFAFPSFVLTSNPRYVGIAIILTLLSCFCAIVLAVTLYGITRDVDHELAMAVLAFRLVEGALGAVGIPEMQRMAPTMMLGAPFFAVGSLIFAYLLLKGRLVPETLGRIGIVASALLVVTLPLQFGGYLSGKVTSIMWLPMLAFEVPLGLWLMVKGVAAPVTAAPPRRWG